MRLYTKVNELSTTAKGGDLMLHTFTAYLFSCRSHIWYQLTTATETVEEARQQFYSEMEEEDIILKIIDEKGYLV